MVSCRESIGYERMGWRGKVNLCNENPLIKKCGAEVSNIRSLQALNRNLNLQRFKILYIGGNYLAILNELNRRFGALEIHGALSLRYLQV